MKKILVTGGAGFIGSHTCVELVNSGYDVIVFDNFSNSKPDVMDKIETITGKKLALYNADLLNIDDIRKVFNENKISGVIHFAGLKAVGESTKIPLDYYNNNITGTLNLCRVMSEFLCKVMIFSSSATVYGMNNKCPFKEDSPLSATNPYGFTKLFIEQILTDLYNSDNEWSTCLLRYFNPVGAHSSGIIGENPNGIPNNLMPYISQVAVGKLEELSVFGNDYNTIDGTGVRDYIHVVDLAKGHISALNYALEKTGVEAINLGTGEGTSVLQLCEAYEKACSIAIKRRIAPRRAGDIDICYADTEKAARLLNWKAELTIDDMCKDSWRFIQGV